jgi:hypothetical protein
VRLEEVAYGLDLGMLGFNMTKQCPELNGSRSLPSSVIGWSELLASTGAWLKQLGIQPQDC